MIITYKHTINLADILSEIVSEDTITAIEFFCNEFEIELMAEVSSHEIVDMLDSIDVGQHSDILVKLSPCLFKGGNLGKVNECSYAIIKVISAFTETSEAMLLAEDAMVNKYAEMDETNGG